MTMLSIVVKAHLALFALLSLTERSIYAPKLNYKEGHRQEFFP